MLMGSLLWKEIGTHGDHDVMPLGWRWTLLETGINKYSSKNGIMYWYQGISRVSIASRVRTFHPFLVSKSHFDFVIWNYSRLCPIPPYSHKVRLHSIGFSTPFELSTLSTLWGVPSCQHRPNSLIVQKALSIEMVCHASQRLNIIRINDGFK